MHWLTRVFVAALSAETMIRLWLASRQIATVHAHREWVPEMFRGRIAPTDQRRAADYTIARVRLGRWTTLVESLINLGLTVGGGLAAIDAWLSPLQWSGPAQGCLLIATVFLLLQLFRLPFALWRTFRIEARFGFNRISPWLFTVDFAKRLLMGAVLGAPLALAILLLMEKAGPWWWTWAWLLGLGVMLTLTWAAPRFIAPLFNRFTPITDATLKRRVESLLERCGFSARGGVFVMDGSRRSAHGNAYFTGVGRNKRIVFFDTLLAGIGPAEIEAVLAHELGHFRLHHVRQRLIVSMLTTLGGLALLGWVAEQPVFYSAFGVPVGSASMALLLFTLIVPVFAFFATPIESWWSRRQEFAADDFAAKTTDASDLVRALITLYRHNATTLTPDPLHSAFYDSHPSAPLRIARLNTLAHTADRQRGVGPPDSGAAVRTS